MTELIEKIRLPIRDIEVYSVEEDDDRFQKVKIWIAHTGENLNGTSFSHETLESMIPSLAWVPILGYIEKNSADENDFSDHRSRIVLKDGDIEHEYLGHSYGFIPESPNAEFEYRGGKEWLTAEGYLWTKFDKGIEIIANSNGSKSQSMEINVTDGYVDDDAVFNVTKARFTGLCILGDEVAPAMSGSTIEFFSADIFKEEIRKMMYEFSQKGVKASLENNELDNVVDSVETEVVENEEVTLETPEELDAENFTEDLDGKTEELEVVDSENPEEPEDNNEGEVEQGDPENYQMTFSYSFEDTRTLLHSYLYKKEEYEDGWVYLVETHDDHVIYSYESYEWPTVPTKYYKASYEIKDGVVTMGDKSEVLSMFVSEDEKNTIEENRTYIKELTEELKALSEFKAEVDKTEKLKVLESYKEELSGEAFSVLEDTLGTMTTEELEKEIVFSIYKSQQQQEEAQVTARVSSYSYKNTTGRYGDLERLFYKKGAK